MRSSIFGVGLFVNVVLGCIGWNKVGLKEELFYLLDFCCSSFIPDTSQL